MDHYAIRQLLDAHWDQCLPVDPFSLARAWGAKINSLRQSPYPAEGLSGLAIIEQNIPKIYVNDADHHHRQRFTVAHELAHHILGHTINGECRRDSIDNFFINAAHPREMQANRLAVQLLMPETAIKAAVTHAGITCIERLAALFCVAQGAVNWRLEGVGLAV